MKKIFLLGSFLTISSLSHGKDLIGLPAFDKDAEVQVGSGESFAIPKIGTYVNFDSSSFLSWFSLAQFNKDDFRVEGQLVYGKLNVTFIDMHMVRSKDDSTVWLGEGGNFSVFYGGDRRYSCFFPVHLKLYAVENGGFKVRVWAPNYIPSYYNNGECQRARNDSSWRTLQPTYAHRRAFFKEAVNLELPDGAREGILVDFNPSAFTRGNNYNYIKVELYVDHPHINDILIEVTRPDGEVLKMKRIIQDSKNLIFTSSSMPKTGNWKIRVYDNWIGSVGTLKEVKLKFQ